MDLDTEKQPKQNSSHLPKHANYKYTCQLHATFYIIKLLDLILLRLHKKTAMKILIIK